MDVRGGVCWSQSYKLLCMCWELNESLVSAISALNQRPSSPQSKFWISSRVWCWTRAMYTKTKQMFHSGGKERVRSNCPTGSVGEGEGKGPYC